MERRTLFLLLALLLVALMAGPGARAETVCTSIGCVIVNEGGYLLVADGDAANPDPGDGFVSVSSGGQVCADDNGMADDGNPANGAESTSPTCLP